MKKIKNRGFIATSILFGIVALLFITFAILLGNSRAALKNDRIYGYMLKGDITNLSGIKLHPNGGTIKKTLLEIDFNGTYAGLPEVDSEDEPKREGYDFIGWYTGKDAGVLVEAATVYHNVKANILYAHWSKNMYTLSINPNGGSYNGSTAINSFPLYFGDQKEVVNPTRTGYIFDGWELKGNGSKIDGGTFQMGYENTELKAKWVIKDVTLTVDPKSGTWEGSNELQTFELSYRDTKEIPDPVREGYTFTGWTYETENATLNGKVLTMGEKDILLTANWQINNYPYIIKHYQQAIDTDDFVLVNADTEEGEAEFGSIIIPPYKEYVGFQVLGDLADLDSEGKIKPQTLIISTDISKNLVEYKYGRILYLVKINPNGGTYDGNLETYYRYGTRVELNTPKRTGYTFANWSKTAGTIENNAFIVGSSDSTITANWNANEYVLTLEPNGGSVTLPQFKVKYDDKYGSIEEPVRTGYTFKGWSTTSDGKNIINADTVIKTASDHKLYAVWEANQYTVTLYPRGGTVNPTTIKVTFGEKYNLPDPTKYKHDFLGWYTDSVNGVLINSDTEVSLAEDHNLYARWIPMDAEFIQYSNPTYTTCTNVACTLNELFKKLNNE